mgnify:CR=1 FL=1
MRAFPAPGDRTRQDYDIAGFADDMSWLIREIGLDRPVIVGHSMGGNIVMLQRMDNAQLGSLVAVCVIWVLVTMLGGGYLALLDSIPGISRQLVETTAVRLTADGLPYTPLLILGGVPLKLYAALGFTFGMSLGALLLWTIFARIARIAPVFALVALVRVGLRRHVDVHPRLWITLHLFVWVAFYAFYFWKMR